MVRQTEPLLGEGFDGIGSEQSSSKKEASDTGASMPGMGGAIKLGGEDAEIVASYIHSRAITVGIRDWRQLIDECWRYLEPGGWVEFQEYHCPFECDDDTIETVPAFNLWNKSIMDATRITGTHLDAILGVGDILRERGFFSVSEAQTKWALGPWPKGKREKNRVDERVIRLKPAIADCLPEGWRRWTAHDCWPARVHATHTAQQRRLVCPQLFLGPAARAVRVVEMFDAPSQRGRCSSGARRVQWDPAPAHRFRLLPVSANSVTLQTRRRRCKYV